MKQMMHPFDLLKGSWLKFAKLLLLNYSAKIWTMVPTCKDLPLISQAVSCKYIDIIKVRIFPFVLFNYYYYLLTKIRLPNVDSTFPRSYNSFKPKYFHFFRLPS